MRSVLITSIAWLALFSCSKPSSDSAKQEDDKEQDEPKKKKANDESKPAKKSSKTSVKAHSDVPRYVADQGWGWAKHDFMKRYSIAFPVDLEFKLTDKKDHTSAVASTVYKGTIYRVEVRDYSKSKSADTAYKEAGFLKFSGTSEAKFLSAKIAERSDVELRGPIAAHYMTYTWELEKEYFVDWLAFNVDDHVIVLSTSSRPKYDAAARLEEFFNSFVVRE